MRVAEGQEDEKALMEELEVATSKVQVNVGDLTAQQHQGAACEHLDKFQARSIAGRKVHSRIRWKLKRDLVSKEFFVIVKDRPKFATIASFMDKLGQRVTDHASMEQTVLSFYR